MMKAEEEGLEDGDVYISRLKDEEDANPMVVMKRRRLNCTFGPPTLPFLQKSSPN
jgi:hypothetical protein